MALPAAAVPTGTLLASKPNSDSSGMQIGAIRYTYRIEPCAGSAREFLKMVFDTGVSAIELMSPAAEASFNSVDRRPSCL